MPSSKKNAAILTPAELVGQVMLESWLEAHTGRGVYLAGCTGMDAASISRMKKGRTAIDMEAAILIELATDRALKAEILCPSKSAEIKRFRDLEDGTPLDSMD